MRAEGERARDGGFVCAQVSVRAILAREVEEALSFNDLFLGPGGVFPQV